MRRLLDDSLTATLGKRFIKQLSDGMLQAKRGSATRAGQLAAVKAAMRKVLGEQLVAVGGNLTSRLNDVLMDVHFMELRRRLGEGAECGVLGGGRNLIHTIFKQFGKVAFAKEAGQQRKLQAAVDGLQGVRQALATLLDPEQVCGARGCLVCCVGVPMCRCPHGGWCLRK